MKKLFWALMASMTMFACSAIDDTTSKDDSCDVCKEDPCLCEDAKCPDCGENPCACAVPNPDFTPLQPSSQKSKISEVGEKMLDKLPAEDWKRYSQLVEDFANSAYVSDSYNWGKLEDWFEEEYNEVFKYNEDETFKNGVVTHNWDTEIIVLMANHKGHFECTESGVKIKDYSGGTKATFDLNGKKYEFEIAPSGKVTEAIYLWEEYSEYGGSDYYDDYGNLIAENVVQIYKDKYYAKVGVPEKIKITVKENSSYLMDVEVSFTANFSKDNVNVTTDSFSTSVTASINGVEIEVNKVAYNATTGKAEYKTGVKKNGESLITTSASVQVKMREEEYEYRDEWSDDYYEIYRYTYYEVDKAQDAALFVDILGEIQVKGLCANIEEAYEELDAMWEELSDYDWETGYSKTPNVNEANRHLDNFNAKISLYVYYDGTDTRQATVKYALQSETDYWGDTYYEVIPILEFGDGSKYKIEEFFTEKAFGGLVDSFYELLESYGEVFEFEFL